MRSIFLAALGLLAAWPLSAAQPAAGDASVANPKTPVVLKPARVFDGESETTHEGWIVVVHGERIEAAGPAQGVKVPAGARTIELPGMTLLPGLSDSFSTWSSHDVSL